jgi:hypothetical protein
MIAMQYSLVLPADYDMGIIEQRIADRGHATDGFPGLAFKAYLHAGKQDVPASADNMYAPFYLWHTTEGMNEFLCGPGFQSLTRSFGWPLVRTWSVWHAQWSPEAATARYAIRETALIAPHADLASLRDAESEGSKELASKNGVLATVVAFEPTDWSLVRFQLRNEMPEQLATGQTQIYRVGHVSTA